MGRASLLLLLLATAALARANNITTRQPTVGYQLQYPRTNAIGAGATAVLLNEQLWVVGGSGDPTRGPLDAGLSFLYQDTRRFDVASRVWSNRAPLAQAALAFHTCNAFAGALFVFGGSLGGGVLSDSMYRYTIATDSWQTVVPSTATRPTARAGHASFVVGDRLFVFGGVRSDGSVANDVWSFTFTTGVWLQITPGAGGNALGPRYLHVAVQGPVASQVCLWGGSIDGANRALAQGSTASNAVYCFDVTTSTWTAARNAPPTIGTRVAPVLLESSVAGFAVMGGVAQDASVGTRLFAYRYATDAWTNTLASPVAYAAHAPATVAGAFAYIAGGIIGASGAWNTRVLAVGPAGVWTEQQLACEKGYAGATCAQPLCAQNCWGVGRCVAPDLCECLEGFTGALCTQQRCSECGINLVDLNQPVLWPRAKARAFQCMDALEALIAGVEASLPGFPAKCGQTYQNNYPLSLKVSSKQAWFFNQDTARPLADIAAATAALVSAVA